MNPYLPDETSIETSRVPPIVKVYSVNSSLFRTEKENTLMIGWVKAASNENWIVFTPAKIGETVFRVTAGVDVVLWTIVVEITLLIGFLILIL